MQGADDVADEIGRSEKDRLDPAAKMPQLAGPGSVEFLMSFVAVPSSHALFPSMDSSRPLSSSPAGGRTREEAGGEASARLSAGLTAEEQDLAWMRLVRTGDRQAFAELVECHQNRVVGTVARMLGGDAHDAEDIGQQVFLRIWKSAVRYEPTAKFTTWLYTITRNLVFNELRRRKNRPVTSLDAPMDSGDFGSSGAQFVDHHTPAPDATLLEGELQQAISDAIASLPENQRMAIVLRRYEELSYEEIAAALDLTVPAVKSLLFRARSILRDKLAGYLEG